MCISEGGREGVSNAPSFDPFIRMSVCALKIWFTDIIIYVHYLWNQGDRNCYMCGSPDHLIRDCPAASSSHPHNHTGSNLQ